ncbi:MAG: tetratricopeptide repeat protein [Verrucomicrobia bacterium]|nr:tetratricopeptide repeat protein [Verrucomicrobiota bacterium]
MDVRLAASVALIVLALFPAHAAVLTGVVIENHAGGPGMDNVAISVDEAAAGNPTTSKDGGKFTLTIPDKHPGEIVHVRVSKQGYTVVNGVQLETVLPANPDANPLTIILCPEAEREQWAGLLYRVTSDKVIESTYQEKLRILEHEHHADAAPLAQLQQERSQAKAAAEMAAEAFARIPPGQGSDRYRQAKRLFLDADLTGAIQLLDDAKSTPPDVENGVQEWLLKAQLLILGFRFEEAGDVYRQALAAKPGSFEVNLAYGVLNQALNRVDDARAAYSRCLEWARKTGNADAVATALNHLAVLDNDQSRFDDGRNEYREALRIRRNLVETYSSAMAATLNDLAVLDSSQDRPDDARDEYEEALQTYRRLARQNPDTYLPAVALTLNNLGNLDSDQNRPDEARREYQEALQIRRKLAENDPQTHLSAVAATLNNLGNLDRDQHRPDDARREYQEALQIRGKLARQSADSDLGDVAQTLNNLGNLDSGEDRPDDARKEYREALQIRRKLAETNPKTHLPAVAETLNNLAVVDRGRSGPDEARKEYQEALRIYRQLARQNPQAYLQYAAATLNNLGNLDADQHRPDEARQEYQEALQIRRKLAETDPDAYLPAVAQTLNNLGNLDHNRNRPDQARKEYQEALQIYEAAAKRNPERFLPVVALVKRLLAQLPR